MITFLHEKITSLNNMITARLITRRSLIFWVVFIVVVFNIAVVVVIAVAVYM